MSLLLTAQLLEETEATLHGVPPVACLSSSSNVVAGLTTCGTQADYATREVNPVTLPNDELKVWNQSEGHIQAVVLTWDIVGGMSVAFCCSNAMKLASMAYRLPINLPIP